MSYAVHKSMYNSYVIVNNFLGFYDFKSNKRYILFMSSSIKL